MARRIPFRTLLGAASSHYYRKLAVDMAGPIRALMVSAGKPHIFHDNRPTFKFGDKVAGAALLNGYFHYADQKMDVGSQGDPWTVVVPSARFAQWLHGFRWMPDLAVSSDKNTGPHARSLIDKWIVSYGKFNSFAWAPDVLTNRLYNWLTLWSPLLTGDNMSEAAQIRRQSVLRQLKYLRGIYKQTSPGLSRLRAAAVLVLGGMRLKDKSERFLSQGLDWLDDEIDIQILPDGGHISRSPEQSLAALEILMTLDSLLQARGVEGSKAMSRAIDRLSPVIAFFTGADGTLVGFNGGSETSTARVKAVMKTAQKIRKSGPIKAFGYCPHTRYQRIGHDGTVLIVDAGTSPRYPFNDQAHLAPLAFEFSTSLGKLIVNCGWSEQQTLRFRRSVRTTAAHTSLTLADRDAGSLLAKGWKSKFLGEVVECEAGPVNATRKEQVAGTWLEVSHDGYRRQTGLTHKRRFFMSTEGNDVRGEDSLFVPLGAAPLSRDEIAFDIRFHLHPSVRVSLSQDQRSALLIQSGKAGWRFRTDGGILKLENSIYLGAGMKPVKSQQIIISGNAFCDSDGSTKSNCVRWSFKKLEPRKA